jgi:hypothetical protein
MNRTELGKISYIALGYGGYQDAMMGLSVSIEGKGWGTNDFIGTWAGKRSEHAKWTEQDRDAKFAEVVHKIESLLKEAKVQSMDKLKGKPVECTFDGNLLIGWRILEEVL